MRNVFGITIEPVAGSHILTAARAAIALARVLDGDRVTLAFNGERIDVNPDDGPADVEARYVKALARREQAQSRLPDGYVVVCASGSPCMLPGKSSGWFAGFKGPFFHTSDDAGMLRGALDEVLSPVAAKETRGQEELRRHNEAIGIPARPPEQRRRAECGPHRVVPIYIGAQPKTEAA